MEKEIRISVSLETGNNTEIVIVENGININGIPASLDDCMFWTNVFKGIRNLFMMQGHRILKDTVNDIMNIK